MGEMHPTRMATISLRTVNAPNPLVGFPNPNETFGCPGVTTKIFGSEKASMIAVTTSGFRRMNRCEIFTATSAPAASAKAMALTKDWRSPAKCERLTREPRYSALRSSAAFSMCPDSAE